jgi:hypothetical protein
MELKWLFKVTAYNRIFLILVTEDIICWQILIIP